MSNYVRMWFDDDGRWVPTLALAPGIHEFPGTKGVCVGRCVEGKDWNDPSIQGRSGAIAHAHQNGKFDGWVCIGESVNAWMRHNDELKARKDLADCEARLAAAEKVVEAAKRIDLVAIFTPHQGGMALCDALTAYEDSEKAYSKKHAVGCAVNNEWQSVEDECNCSENLNSEKQGEAR